MDAGAKDVLRLLLIGIVGTAVGSGSIFILCRFLWKLVKTCYNYVTQPPAAPDDESGDQPAAAQAIGLHDVEMGPVNGEAGRETGEAVLA